MQRYREGKYFDKGEGELERDKFQQRRERMRGGIYREWELITAVEKYVLAKNIYKQSIAHKQSLGFKAVTTNCLVREQSIGYQSLG